MSLLKQYHGRRRDSAPRLFCTTEGMENPALGGRVGTRNLSYCFRSLYCCGAEINRGGLVFRPLWRDRAAELIVLVGKWSCAEPSGI